MVTGDAAYIKKINRTLILQEILKEGSISRANLSKVTALTRATVSAQVADLIQDGLLIEKHIEHNMVGRKPIMLSVNGEAGYALGIDLESTHITFMITDLLGRPISTNVVANHSADYSSTLKLLIKHINDYRKNYADRRYGIVGIVISVHGLVHSDEMIHYVPRLKWEKTPLKQDLESALGTTVHIDNNANLTAYAERVFVHHETVNLISATLYSGIGMGMIVNDKYFCGHDGFAGEIGHMIVVPEGISCECGNKGCWEKYASENVVFSEIAKLFPDQEISYTFILQKYYEDDKELIQILERFIYYISIGINNIINIYNPEIVVLDSELLRIYPDALNKIKANLHSRVSHYDGLYISSIGKQSCTLGACARAIQKFLDIPSLCLPYIK